MIIAEIEGLGTLEFDNDTPDDEIDRRVKQYVDTLAAARKTQPAARPVRFVPNCDAEGRMYTLTVELDDGTSYDWRFVRDAEGRTIDIVREGAGRHADQPFSHFDQPAGGLSQYDLPFAIRGDALNAK